jgi:hypothetical protein
LSVTGISTRFPPLVRARRYAAAVPVWAWLGVFIGVSTIARAAVAKGHRAPFIFDDELIYSKLASSFANTGHFAVRSVNGLFGYAPGYPLLISPAYFVFDNGAHAYTAAKGINALLMSLAAVPAYLIGRRLVSPWLALAGAVLALALPSVEYTGTIMTENAFYPAFLLCVWGFLRMFETPTLARQALALGLVALAATIRVQALLFAAALGVAIVVVAIAEAARAGEARWSHRRALVRRLDAFRLVWIVLGAAVILGVAVQVARGRSLGGLLGAYGDVTTWDYSVGTIARWFVYHVADLDMYSGFLPFAAFVTIAVGALGRAERSRTVTAFGAVSLSLFVCLAVPAAALSAHMQSVGPARIEERNVFYVVPLFVIATLVWVERGLPRGRLAALAAALAAALPGVLPFAKLVNLGALSDTFALVPLVRRVIDGTIGMSQLPLAVVSAAILGAGVFLFVPRRAAMLVPVAVLVFFVVWQLPLERQLRATSLGLLEGSIGGYREWIDNRIGGNATVAALWSGNVNPTVITENEFFNRSVRRVYSVSAPPLPAQVPETPATVNEQTGALVSEGSPVHSEWVLGDRALEPAGRVVARDARIGTALYRTNGAVRLQARTTGIYGDRWSTDLVGYTRWQCRGGRLVAELRNYPGLVAGGQRVTARGAGRAVSVRFSRREQRRRLVVGLRSVGGICTARFTIDPVGVPAQVFGTADTRALGVRFDDLRYEAPR